MDSGTALIALFIIFSIGTTTVSGRDLPFGVVMRASARERGESKARFLLRPDYPPYYR